MPRPRPRIFSRRRRPSPARARRVVDLPPRGYDACGGDLDRKTSGGDVQDVPGVALRRDGRAAGVPVRAEKAVPVVWRQDAGGVERRRPGEVPGRVAPAEVFDVDEPPLAAGYADHLTEMPIPVDKAMGPGRGFLAVTAYPAGKRGERAPHFVLGEPSPRPATSRATRVGRPQEGASAGTGIAWRAARRRAPSSQGRAWDGSTGSPNVESVTIRPSTVSGAPRGPTSRSGSVPASRSRARNGSPYSRSAWCAFTTTSPTRTTSTPCRS